MHARNKISLCEILSYFIVLGLTLGVPSYMKLVSVCCIGKCMRKYRDMFIICSRSYLCSVDRFVSVLEIVGKS